MWFYIYFIEMRISFEFMMGISFEFMMRILNLRWELVLNL